MRGGRPTLQAGLDGRLGFMCLIRDLSGTR